MAIRRNVLCRPQLPILTGIILLLLAIIFNLPIPFPRPIPVHIHVRYYQWELTYKFKSPDCHRKLVIAVNGESPGPTIQARKGDTIVVRVKNRLDTENAVVHWHGIRQKGTPWSDGTDGVTQCPIMPGETFEYKFVVDRAGTFMYHAHSGMQRSAGLYGMFNVDVDDGEVEPFAYDYDRSFILSDWWHQSIYEQAAGLASVNPFVFVGEPQSLLINGRGKFNCSQAKTAGLCNETSPDCSPVALTVIPGMTYRLRLASITSLSALSFEVEGHSLTVVEADGHYVKPFVVKHLYIYTGETYSVLLTANQDPSRNYWAAINVVSRPPQTPPGLAIVNYPPNHPFKPPPTRPPTGPMWNDTSDRLRQSLAIRAHPAYVSRPPATASRHILLLNEEARIKDHIRWSLNNASLNMPNTPYLVALKRGLQYVFDQKTPNDTYDYKHYQLYKIPNNTDARYDNAIYKLDYGSVVDAVLQNANTYANRSETHPWHLHGHDFWILGYGQGKFDPEVDPKRYNLVDPIKKNTVAVHPYGWTAVRFRADNPGVWVFHCHIEAHLVMGMGVMFAEGVDEVPKLPRSIMGCGESKKLIQP